MIRSNSRWWYWVAAVPAVVAFWLASVVWVGVSAWLQFAPGELAAGVGRTALLAPLVAFGVPLAAVFLVHPLALAGDGRAVRAAGADWPPVRSYVAAAVLGDLLVVGGLLALRFGLVAVGALGIGAGVLIAVAVAVQYLRARRERVHMPSSLREWREELRAAE